MRAATATSHWQANGSLDPRRLRSARLLLRDAGQPGKRRDPRTAGRAIDRRAEGTRRRGQCRALQSRDHLHGLFRRQDDRPHPAVRRVAARACRRTNGAISKAASSSASPRSTCCSTTSTTIRRSCADGIVPADLILGNRNYRPVMRGVDLPHKAYVNICGTDIVRDENGRLSGARGQCAHPVGGQLRRREPPHDAARLSRPARRHRPAPDRQLRRAG